MSPDTRTEKVREVTLRRTATRRGLTITKNRRRDPLAIGYGMWRVTRNGKRVHEQEWLTLDEVEHLLNDPPK